MRRLIIYVGWLVFLTIFVLLAGCATVGSAATSKRTFAACRVADVATTTAIIRSGGVELNPIIRPLLAHGFFPFFAFEAAVIWFAWRVWDDLAPPVKLVANVTSCWPIPNNSALLAAGPRR